MKSKTLKNGAFVCMERVQHSGFYVVTGRKPNGELFDKVSCDTYRAGLEYFRAFQSIARGF